jgi:hypothetical protein
VSPVPRDDPERGRRCLRRRIAPQAAQGIHGVQRFVGCVQLIAKESRRT